MAARARLHVICYDIADNKRRRRVAALLEEQAARVQESVFELRITSAAAKRLLEALKKECGQGDSLRLYAVPDAALPTCQSHGGPAIAGGGRYWLT